MKTTPRPNQSDDLQLDSAVIVASTWDQGSIDYDAAIKTSSSDSVDDSETHRWAATPSKWNSDSHRGEASDWNKEACLEFRVRCEGQPTRRLRLAGARYTLGNGVGCSIRLDDPSLRPLHAVLIRDRSRVLVRAYSVPILINETRVTEGTLDLHDRLRLGGYEFELLEHTPLPEPVVKPARATSASRTETKQPQPAVDSKGKSSEKDEWERSFHEEAKHWRALKQDIQRRDDWCRTREQEVLEQRQWLDRQIEALQKRQEELSSQESAAIEVHDEFSERFDELQHRQKEIELQQEELEAGREHLRLQQERLDGRDRLHRLQIEKLLGEQERFKDQNAQYDRIIADAEKQVRLSQERADAANAAVEQMRLKFSSLNEQLLELTEQQGTLQRLETERNQEHQLRCDDLAMARDEAISQRDENARQRDVAIDAKAQSDARREKTLLRCDQLEEIEEQLRSEIKQLQEEIAATRTEATQLDEEFKSARQTIAKLEETLQTSEQRHESDRESWTHEVETLRKNIDDLTMELAGAQTQLSQLRDDNERLAEQLTGAHEDRDDARQKQEIATRECEAANQACAEAKVEIETARRQLADALTQCDDARQDREQIQAQRDQINGELKTTRAEREDWERRTELAERRFADAQSLLAEARDQWQKAEHARDDAETQRSAAERKLADAQLALESMQVERDQAVSEFHDLRQQRDAAVEDAHETRRLYDRSNRDHDDTLDRIESLERQTREVINDKKKISAKPIGLADLGEIVSDDQGPTTLGLVREEASDARVDEPSIEAHHEPALASASEAVDELLPESSVKSEDTSPNDEVDDDVWPTYSVAPSTPSPDSLDESIDASVEVNEIASFDNSSEETPPVDMPPIPESMSHARESTPGWADAGDVGSISGVYEIASDAAAEPESLPQWPTDEQSFEENEDSVDSEPSASLVDPASPDWPEETASHLLPEDHLDSDRDFVDPVAVETAESDLSYSDYNDGEVTDEESPSFAGFNNGGYDQDEYDDAPMNFHEMSRSEAAPSEVEESLSDRLLREMGLAKKEAEQVQAEEVDTELSADEQPVDEQPNAPDGELYSDFQDSDFQGSDLSGEPHADFDNGVEHTAAVNESMLSELRHLESCYDENTDDFESEASDNMQAESVNMTAQWQPGAMLNATEESINTDDGDFGHDGTTSEASLSEITTSSSQALFSEAERVAPIDDPQADSGSPDQSESDSTDDAITPAASTSEPPADDDSIEAYMNRLLQRVQGQTAVAPTAEKTPKTKPIEPKPKTQPVASSAIDLGSESETEKPMAESPNRMADVSDDAPLVPRSQAPERNSNLSAMRELANESARNAIHRSNKSQSHTTRVQAMLKFVYAAVALLCGLVAVAMIDLMLLKCIAVIAALLTAGIFVKEGFTLMTGLVGRNRNSEPAPVAEETEA